MGKVVDLHAFKVRKFEKQLLDEEVQINFTPEPVRESTSKKAVPPTDKEPA